MVYWIFGYGSLIFKPPPHTVEQQPGYVKGVVRRFAQSSNDHRGTPESPGRVVTVVESRDWHELEGIQLNEGEVLQEDCVWGIAYRIDSEKEDEVRSYMGGCFSLDLFVLINWVIFRVSRKGACDKLINFCGMGVLTETCRMVTPGMKSPFILILRTRNKNKLLSRR
nr:hypothetical protein L204_02509 [Cryptococcus depauperatus CBS 7855]